MILFENEHAQARCLWVAGEHLYAGWSWTDDDERGNELTILDAGGALVRTWKLRYLVSDVAVVGDRCFAALGPGELAVWPSRGLQGEPTVAQVDANAPTFAVHGDTLMWGTSWGEIHDLDRGLIANVKKSLTDIAIDGQRIYAAYEDGKVRVFSRDGKSVKVLAAGKKAIRCSLAGDTLVTVDARSGDTISWSTTGFEKRAAFVRDSHGADYGVIGVGLYAQYIVSRTFDDVEIHDREGKLVGAWRSPEGNIEDVWPDDRGLIIAAGSRVYRVMQADLRA